MTTSILFEARRAHAVSRRGGRCAVTVLALVAPASGCGEDGGPATVGAGGGGASAGGGGGGGGGGADGGGAVSLCVGKLGAPVTTNRAMDVGGISRSFIVHIPESLDPNVPVPVVFAFHGFTMSDQIMMDLTGFADVADREGFIAVFPNGQGASPWNVGSEPLCGAGAIVNDPFTDDIEFTAAMLEDIEADHCIARDEVFVTGFSMGGYFTNHVACQAGEMLRAVAPHSGGTYEGDCPGAPVPIMIVHGDADPVIVPECGSQARDLWVARNGCSTEVDVVMVKGGACEWSLGCPPGGQVVYCSFEGMLHGWAGVDGLNGGGNEYEDATELIWSFFEAQL